MTNACHSPSTSVHGEESTNLDEVLLRAVWGWSRPPGDGRADLDVAGLTALFSTAEPASGCIDVDLDLLDQLDLEHHVVAVVSLSASVTLRKSAYRSR